MSHLRFEHPLALLLLLALPATVIWRIWRGRAPVMIVPYAASWTAGLGQGASWRTICLYVALALLILALARPQLINSVQKIEQQGYDLMLVMDLSTSMLSEDYSGEHGPVNRLETIRPVLQAFVKGRPNDRIGVVVFAKHALTLAPLTTDHAWLGKQIAALRTGLIDDGTAIGDGLGLALNGLQAGRRDETDQAGKPSQGAFVVLLTDGGDNAGDLTPADATALARYRKIPVYTVGTGRNGQVPFPVFDAAGRRVGTTQQPSEIDIPALQTIAAQTGGRFFMAGDTAALRAAFRAIDASQKARFRVRAAVTVRELYAWLAGLAFVVLTAAGWRTANLPRPLKARTQDP